MAKDLDELRNDVLREGCVSDFAIDRDISGELEDEDQLKHIATCEHCAVKKAAFMNAREAFADRPALAPVEQEQEELTPPPKRLLRFVALGGGVLAAAAAVLILVGPPAQDTVRTKGDVALGFYVKRGDVVEKGGPGEILRAGDEVRFTMRLDKPARVAVLSLDGAGVASVYYPGPGVVMPEIKETNSDVPLPLSTRLDDTLGKEQLIGLACDHAVDLEATRRVLQRDKKLKPLSGCTIDVIAVEKR